MSPALLLRKVLPATTSVPLLLVRNRPPPAACPSAGLGVPPRPVTLESDVTSTNVRPPGSPTPNAPPPGPPPPTRAPLGWPFPVLLFLICVCSTRRVIALAEKRPPPAPPDPAICLPVLPSP